MQWLGGEEAEGSHVVSELFHLERELIYLKVTSGLRSS